MSSATLDMRKGPLLKNIIFYTIPIILTGLLQLAFSAADLMVVGRFCGSLSIAAIGATGDLINLIVNFFFIGLSTGISVAVAQGIGADDRKGVVRTVHTAIPVAFVGGLLLTLVGFFFSRSFLQWMDTPKEVLSLSTLYMKIYFLGTIPGMVYNFGAAILRAAGDSKGPLVYLTIAGCVNVVLNLLFVLIFKMDVAGVAIATSLSQVVAAILVVIALMRRSDCCRLEFDSLQFDKLSFFKILRIGIPTGISSSLFAISNVLIQSSINSFGEMTISGNAAAANVEGFIYIATSAFGQTAMIFAGQNVGAKQFKRANKAISVCWILSFLLGTAFGFALWYFARPLLGFYITDSAKAIEYGMMRFAYVILFYGICGIMETFSGALRGLGSALPPMLISILGICVFRFIWLYTFFAKTPSMECLYLCYPLSWVITTVAEGVACGVTIRKLKQSSAGVKAIEQTEDNFAEEVASMAK